MGLIHHVVAGSGAPPLVFVHGFGCDRTDWNAQVAHFSPHHQTIAVDLRGHGLSPGAATDCSIERCGADVAEVMRALDLPPAVLIGHSMGCRIVIEAALQAPDHVAAVVLVDGSQFAPEMGAVMRQNFALPDGYAEMTESIFRQMFTARSDSAVAAAVIARARRLPRPIGEKMLADMQRYDVHRLASSLASLLVPVMAVQCTYSNEKRERQTMRAGQATPYLAMVRVNVPSARVEIIPDTGHFPQLDAAAATNALIEGFVRDVS
ncbi:MAG TPA: alpha/beta hydrolase [Acetobacteraceae bacterium]|jgi:pimeloyl-ACP methyl ester carboxylesterase|nr:alpha/beta hydrolase [Acetobacteraceae bacterium]